MTWLSTYSIKDTSLSIVTDLYIDYVLSHKMTQSKTASTCRVLAQ